MKKQETHIDSLADLQKKQPFKVPDSYFDNFEARLQTRLQQQQQQSREKRSENKVIKMLKPVMWMAASFLLAILLIKIPFRQFFPESLSVKNTKEENAVSIYLLNETNFYDILSEDSQTDTLKTEDLYTYLSSEVNEYEIYSEMYN